MIAIRRVIDEVLDMFAMTDFDDQICRSKESEVKKVLKNCDDSEWRIVLIILLDMLRSRDKNDAQQYREAEKSLKHELRRNSVDLNEVLNVLEWAGFATVYYAKLINKDKADKAIRNAQRKIESIQSSIDRVNRALENNENSEELSHAILCLESIKLV
jgi:hypothetical protein